MKTVENLLHNITGHPFLLFFVVMVVLLPIMLAVVSFTPLLECPRIVERYLQALVAIALLCFAWMTWDSVTTPVFIGHVEPQIPSVSSYYAQGGPLYHDADAAEFYDLPYGPNLYLITAFSQKILGPSFFSSKFPLIAAGDVCLLVLFFVYRRQSSAHLAFLATGLSAALLSCPDWSAMEARSDSLLCLVAAIGLFAAVSKSRAGPLLLGVALGVAVNFKVTAFVYFIPAAAVALRHGYDIRRIVITVVCAVVTAALPFMLPGVSLANYLWFIRAVSHHSLGFDTFGVVMWWAGVMVAPFVVVIWVAWKQNAQGTRQALGKNALLIGAVVVAFLLLVVPASKMGAGGHHLLPWMILLPYLAIQLQKDGLNIAINRTSRPVVVVGAFLLAWVTSCFATTLNATHYITSVLADEAGRAVLVKADIESILATYKKDYIILMGVGDEDTYRLTYYRPYLVFGGMPVGIDPAAHMDSRFAGYPTPDVFALPARLANADGVQRKLLWLIPKNAQPFAKTNGYPPHDLLFDEHFRDTFQRDFKRVGSSEFFDLYSSAGPLAAR